MSSKELNVNKKRKTHTSSTVKNRYNAKTYRKFQATIKPDLFQRIEDYTIKNSISKPEFLRQAINAIERTEANKE